MNFKISGDSLINLLNCIVPTKTITNFHEDWKTARPFGAFISELLPELDLHWHQWTKENMMENLKEAINLVDAKLHLQTFIDPEDFVNGNEKCIYQYLHEIIQKFPFFIFGPGLKEKVTIGQDVSFGLFISYISEQGDVEILITNPEGEVENYNQYPEIRDEYKNRLIRFSYLPEMEGEYKIKIKYNNHEVEGSPVKVLADHTGSDLDKVAASGPGLESLGNKVNRKTHFYIYTAALAEEEYGIAYSINNSLFKKAGNGTVDCVILDPRGRRNSVRPHIRHDGDDKYLVEYTPVEEGLHSINVFFVGHQIPQSPFGVTVGPDCDPKLAYVTGRGVQPHGIRVGDNVEFRIHTKEAGNGEISVVLRNPNNDIHKCQVLLEKEHLYRCFYIPEVCGTYKMEIKMNEEHIAQSPFEMHVKPYINSKIQAYGPGLSTGIVNYQCVFIVETNGETGDIGFSIRGPSETEITCVDNGDGSALISYVPYASGEYAVHVLCNDDNIHKSPFMVLVEADEKQYDSDDILEVPDKIVTQVEKQEIFILAFKKAVLKSSISIECYNQDANMVPVEIHQVDEEGARYRCSMSFQRSQKHRLLIAYHGVNIPQSPIDVYVKELPKPENVKIYGPCLEGCIRNQQSYFIVDCKEAGTGDIEISILDEKGCDVICDMQDHEDGRIEVQLTPRTIGPTYQVQVYYAGIQVPQSPLQIPVKSDLELRKVVITQMRPYVYKESFEKFVIDIRQLERFDSVKVRVRITSPIKKLVGYIMKQVEPGLYHCRYSPLMEGPHQIEVFCNDAPVLLNGKPYSVQVISGYDSSRVFVTGAGIQDGELETSRSFTVDLEGAGQGGLGVAIEGPQRTEMTCNDNEDGTCLVTYFPVEEGEYKILVKFREKDIQGSPFIVQLRNNLPGRHTIVKDMPDELKINNTITFLIDTNDEQEKYEPQVDIIYLSTYSVLHPAIDQDPDNKFIYRVTHKPQKIDNLEVVIKYSPNNDEKTSFKIRGSPFFIKVLPEYDADLIKIYGEGISPSNGFLYVSDTQEHVFTVDFTESDFVPIKVHLKNPDGLETELISNDPEKTVKTEYSYKTTSVGGYTITITTPDNKQLAHSPYHIAVFDGPSVDLPTEITSHTLQPEKSRITSVNSNPPPCEEPLLHNEEESDDSEPISSISKSGDSYEPNIQVEVFSNDHNNLEESIISEISFQSLKESSQNLPLTSDLPTINNDDDNQKLQIKLYEAILIDLDNSANKQNEFKSYQIYNSNENENKTSTHDVKIEKVNKNEMEIKNHGNGPVIEQISLDYHESPIVHSEIREQRSLSPKFNEIKTPVPIIIETVPEEVKEENIEEPIESIFDIVGALKRRNSQRMENDVDHLIENQNDSKDISEISEIENGNSKDVNKVEDQNHVKEMSQISDNGSTELEVSAVDYSNNDEISMVDKEIGRMFHLKYQVPPNDGDIVVEITGPNDEVVETDIQYVDDRNSKVHVYFCTDISGLLYLDLKIRDELDLSTSFHIDEELPIISQVFAQGEGLKYSTMLQWTPFTIGFNSIFNINLTVLIKGPQICHNIQIIDITSKEVHLEYLLTQEGIYLMHIQYMNEDILGSPFLVHCERPNLYYNNLRLETLSELPVKPHKNRTDKLRILALSPTNQKEVWLTKETPNDFVGMMARPKESGRYRLVPYLGNKQLSNKAYSLLVEPHNLPHPQFVAINRLIDDKEVSDWSNVNVEGERLYMDLSIDISDAGFGDLEILVEGPGRPRITNEGLRSNKKGESLVRIEFPCEGLYILSVFFDTQLIKEYPKVILCGSSFYHTTFDRDLIKSNKSTLFEIDQKCEINWSKTGYTSLSNLRAKVTSPSGAVQYCDVLDQDAEHFNIQFQPVENGEHLVSVKNGGMHVPGSPFKIFVGNAEENAAGGAEAVQIYGGGIEGGYINKRNEFSVYTHEAGSGKLTCSIDGPSKATIEMNETGSGTFLINYSMSVPGEYMCSVKFNGDHIFGSPFRLHLEDFHAGYKGQKDHNITLASLQNQNVAVNRSSSFTIHHTGLGTGVMQAVIVSPAGNEESVDIQHLGEDNFNLKLNPKESGLHMIHVYLDGHSIPGSPFQIMVGDISAYGDGLCEGRVGETNTFWLDARTSTAGPLTVTIDGPSKVDLNCVDKDGGYEFSYIANIPGEYIISVKYGLNNHVKGSPFKAMISGVSSNQITVNKSASSRNTHVIDTKRYLNSDELHADRVFCKGDGLYRAFIGRNNQFLIDASHAENSTPFVGIIGPSRPCEEVNIRHLGGRKFQVNYFVQEYGPHDIIVRWGDREITGCPFRAYVH